jgi:protein-tyrosine-phosphatase
MAVLREQGINAGSMHMSRQLGRVMLRKADLIFAMTRGSSVTNSRSGAIG